MAKGKVEINKVASPPLLGGEKSNPLVPSSTKASHLEGTLKRIEASARVYTLPFGILLSNPAVNGAFPSIVFISLR